ncbi:MAG: VWA domain-containing protein, partial [Vicinamibacterales bacterium]
LRIAVPTVAATIALSAQTPQTPPAAPQTPPQTRPQVPQNPATFRSTIEGVQTTVIARNSEGTFVPDLRKEDFQVFEDGVAQTISVFVPVIGGRALQEEITTARPVREGLIMPASRPPQDTSGRIFIIFIDDLHLQALDTPQVRNVLKMIRDQLIHDGDLVGFVSSGYSSISTDLSYDYKHVRFDEAISKVMGSGMTPHDIINMPDTADGPAGLRYNAHTAFSVAYELLKQAEKINNRRKSFIYVSSGYSFNPFKDARYKAAQEKYETPILDDNNGGTVGDGSSGSWENPFENRGQQFAETDLVAEIAELVNAARRANVTFYTIDPRGLIAGPSIGDNLSMQDWREFVTTTVSSLQVLGDETGGFCICMQNDFSKGLARIDAETSDYYVIGYNSTNPDPLRIKRTVEIKVDRPGVELIYRPEYRIERRR